MALQEKLGRFKQQQEKCQSMLSNIAAKSASSRSTPKPAPTATSPFSLLSSCKIMCLKFKTDQAQEAKKMEKLNNIFFTLMARGPDMDMSEITRKEQIEAQPAKKGRGRKQ
ncbi:signal recognition particle 9 kDa protein-like isoform X2 [Gossypium arboreum]|uniref:signal recognition particle 9 kDa protein-like isoform X2 n=1 Tax=Gossypium arboreum TaxID=29729 RepID=UPI0022F1894C|nr:signal recognition particle 9 kDa protein-like isoform X2 [Gossypium arboreum]